MNRYLRTPGPFTAGSRTTDSFNVASLIGGLLGAGLLAIAGAAWAGQPLETESTRLLRSHQFEVEAGFEHQRAKTGTESAAPFAFGYGLSERLELLVEPVFYNRVRDKFAPKVQGFGDLEITLTSRLLDESHGRPAFALAGEIKLPTAKSRRIGSGKTDFTLWTLASRRIGSWDTHANFGYTIIGKPVGVAVNNVLNYAVGEEFHLSPRWEVVGEVFGNTAALAEAADAPAGAGESTTTPEIGGAETIGALGLRLHAQRGWVYSLGVSVDSKSAVLVHPGLTLTF